MAQDNITDGRWFPFTIPAGARDSEAIEGKGRGILKICIIGAWTTSDLTFVEQIMPDGSAADTDYKECWLDDSTRAGVLAANMTAGRIIFTAPDGIGVGFKNKFKVHSVNVQSAGCRGYVYLRGVG
jgi:hypothetical protein